jgi:hypothetical protein
MTEYCDVCKNCKVISEDGEHLCGLTVEEAFSFGFRSGMNQSNLTLEATLRAQMHDELVRERRRLQEFMRVIKVVKKSHLWYEAMQIEDVHYGPDGISVMVRG